MPTMEVQVSFLHCHSCGKQVSTGFLPIPTDTPDKGIIVRAYIECPECITKREHCPECGQIKESK